MSNQTSGLLLIDKPQDFSSNDIIAICRKVLSIKKIGHSGTLDPMATGLLILLVGKNATKRQDSFLKLPKTYCATLRLGQSTDTWDAWGNLKQTLPVPTLSLLDVRRAAEKLTGEITQTIPPFSAKKINGRKMYDLARSGEAMEERTNRVTVYAWKELTFTAPDTLQFTVECSCGTYVRALGSMLAQILGTVGHLNQLRRLKIGSFDVQNAFDGQLLKKTDAQTLLTHLAEVRDEA